MVLLKFSFIIIFLQSNHFSIILEKKAKYQINLAISSITKEYKINFWKLKRQI